MARITVCKKGPDGRLECKEPTDTRPKKGLFSFLKKRSPEKKETTAKAKGELLEDVTITEKPKNIVAGEVITKGLDKDYRKRTTGGQWEEGQNREHEKRLTDETEKRRKEMEEEESRKGPQGGGSSRTHEITTGYERGTDKGALAFQRQKKEAKQTLKEEKYKPKSNITITKRKTGKGKIKEVSLTKGTGGRIIKSKYKY